MQKPLIPLSVFIFSTFFTTAQNQQGRYWTWGASLGMVGWSPTRLDVISGNNYFTRVPSYGYGQVEDLNGRKHLALLANTSLGLNGGHMWCGSHGFTAIQAEVQNNKACYEFKSPFIFRRPNNDSLINWVETDKYFKYSIAIQQGWYFDELSYGSRYFYIRESFGQTLFHRNFADPIEMDHAEDWTYQGNGFKTRVVSFTSQSWMIASEIGLRTFWKDNKAAFDIGMVYYAPFADTFTEEDEFFQKGASVGKSRITFNGGSFMLNLRYSFNYKRKERTIDSVKTKKHEHLVTRKVNGRDMDVQEKVKVKSDSVIVEVWDKGKIDGDRISLYLNDELIASDILLTAEKKKIVIHLQPGVNYLVMHALNLGSIPPNTAAINILGGTVKKSTDLVSDTGKSGAIEIIY